MIGAAVGAGLQVAGAIAGGIMRAKAMKQAEADLARREKENQSWYDRRFNEDATARADAQQAITRTEEAIKNRNRQARGMAAVMGGSQDAVLAAQNANAQAIADTASNIAAAGEARKDAVEQQYLAKKDAFDAQRHQMKIDKMNNIAQAVQGVAGAGSSIAGLDFGAGKKQQQQV